MRQSLNIEVKNCFILGDNVELILSEGNIEFTLEKQSEIQCISVHLAQKALKLALKTKVKWMRFSECEIPENGNLVTIKIYNNKKKF